MERTQGKIEGLEGEIHRVLNFVQDRDTLPVEVFHGDSTVGDQESVNIVLFEITDRIQPQSRWISISFPHAEDHRADITILKIGLFQRSPRTHPASSAIYQFITDSDDEGGGPMI